MKRPGLNFPPYFSPGDPPIWNGGRPFLFTISEVGGNSPLFDVALALYVNPDSVEESMTKIKNTNMTYGGFVEFHWPDDLDSISCSGSTGGFLSPQFGYTAALSKRVAFTQDSGRRGTIAYERFTDLLELFRSNGMIFDGTGTPRIRGRVIMIYDRGAFTGHFTSFDVTEDENKPFSFELSWEFKVESTIYKVRG
jgi:hypothetical protein